MPISKEILKPGDFIDGSGQDVTFTEKNLKKVVENFNEKKRCNALNQKVPLTIAHPKTNSPALGWVSKLYMKGKNVWADFEDVAEVAQKWLKEKMFREVSAALVGPINNLNLRHVGMLGGWPPAVPGLKDFKFTTFEEAQFEFAEGDFNEYEFVSDDHKMRTIGRLFQGVRDYLVEKMGLEKADKVINQWDVDVIKRKDDSSLSFNESELLTFADIEFPFPNEHSARLTDPKQYESWARADNSNPNFKGLPDGVSVVLGIKTVDGKKKSEAQSYRFKIDNFTADQAKAWLKKNNVKSISFEPATKDTKKKELNMDLEEAKKKITELEGEKTQLNTDLEAEKTKSTDFEKKFKDEKGAHEKLKTELSEAETKSLDVEDIALVDKLVSEFKVAPAEKEIILDTLKSQRGREEMEFANPEDEKKPITAKPREHYIKLLNERPAVIVNMEFSEASSATGSKTDSKVQKLVKEKMDKDSKLSHSEASTLVFSEHPSLTTMSADKAEGSESK